MKNKKIHFLACFFLALAASALWATVPSKTSPDNVAKARNSYYNIVASAFGFSASDIAAVRRAGFSPDFSIVLLSIAKKAGVTAETIISLRLKKGYSWKDMCDEYGIDYYPLMDGLEKTLIDNRIIPPLATSGESKKNAATNQRDKGVKK